MSVTPEVSIPYSSGHLFRFCFPDYSSGKRTWSLNPLFIRSSIPFECYARRKQRTDEGLNPLFIRSSIPFPAKALRGPQKAPAVSIPYSSGHLFRYAAAR